MAEIKKTKKIYFNELLKVVKGNEELENFIQHELELLDKKSSSKTPSKTQIENESIKSTILNVLVENAKQMTITDIQSANSELAEFSNQKISALLTQLINESKVIRIVDKKKAYFTIAN